MGRFLGTVEYNPAKGNYHLRSLWLRPVMRIWDTHCHPEGSNVPGRSLLENVENLIQIADRMGTGRLGLSLKPGREDE